MLGANNSKHHHHSVCVMCCVMYSIPSPCKIHFLFLTNDIVWCSSYVWSCITWLSIWDSVLIPNTYIWFSTFSSKRKSRYVVCVLWYIFLTKICFFPTKRCCYGCYLCCCFVMMYEELSDVLAVILKNFCNNYLFDNSNSNLYILVFVVNVFVVNDYRFKSNGNQSVYGSKRNMFHLHKSERKNVLLSFTFIVVGCFLIIFSTICCIIM